jgi:hypothetical protein
LWVILKIGIHRDDNIPMGKFKTGHHGGRLAKVPGKMKANHPMIPIGYVVYYPSAIVLASIVNEDNLEFKVHRFQYVKKLPIQRLDVLFFVEYRDRNRDASTRRSAAFPMRGMGVFIRTVVGIVEHWVALGVWI